MICLLFRVFGVFRGLYPNSFTLWTRLFRKGIDMPWKSPGRIIAPILVTLIGCWWSEPTLSARISPHFVEGWTPFFARS